jgi:membrane-bound inhibitor of C-type lysozyme
MPRGSKSSVTFVLAGIVGLLSVGSAFAETPISTVTFECADDKSIEATFYADKITLSLSDERSMELPQVISGSGTRYANADESFVFWSKGDTAFITEGSDENLTFKDCVAAK